MENPQEEPRQELVEEPRSRRSRGSRSLSRSGGAAVGAGGAVAGRAAAGADVAVAGTLKLQLVP